MKPVARIIPDAKHLTITNKLLSGVRAGIERVNKGEHTPIILEINMEKMAMILRGKAFSLLVQPSVSVLHSSGTTESACGVKMQMMIKKIEKSLTSKEAINTFLGHLT